MENNLSTDVIIVGAGPTGLMAANQLNRFGVDFIIIDGKPGPTLQSRAIAVTSRSLEIYEQMGLSEEVLAEGQRINSFHFYSDGKQKGKVILGEIGKGFSDFNFMLAYEQSKNEALLYRHLLDDGKDVAWGTSFVSIQEYETYIEIVATDGVSTFPIRAKYLIACDGASSPVRHQLQLKFEGGTYENKFFVADTLLRWSISDTGLIISPGAKNFVAFFPMKGNSNYRVIGTLPDDFYERTDITFNDIKTVVIETLGINIEFDKVNWFSVYNLHHRRVDQFRKGNVFVAGDAAHIHSPAGGQGMNTGLQDAYNLAWKLAFVIKGFARPALLETYNEERLPFAKWLMSFTDRGFNLMTSDFWLNVFIRKHFAKHVVGMFLKFKWIRPIAFKTVSQIGYSYQGMSLSASDTRHHLKFKSGDRLPYVKEEGSSKSIYHYFRHPAFHLLHISNLPLDKDFLETLKFHFPLPLVVVESQLPLWKKMGVRKELFIIVRPDNYIMYITDILDATAVKQHLEKFFAF